MIPAASSFLRRSARIFVAIPSPDSWNSLNVRKPRTIRSRMISSDQRSPRISREMLTGQPDRRPEVGLRNTLDGSRIACRMQVKTGDCHRFPLLESAGSLENRKPGDSLHCALRATVNADCRLSPVFRFFIAANAAATHNVTVPGFPRGCPVAFRRPPPRSARAIIDRVDPARPTTYNRPVATSCKRFPKEGSS